MTYKDKGSYESSSPCNTSETKNGRKCIWRGNETQKIASMNDERTRLNHMCLDWCGCGCVCGCGCGFVCADICIDTKSTRERMNEGCSVLQCVAICRNVLQVVAVCCSVLQCVVCKYTYRYKIDERERVRECDRGFLFPPSFAFFSVSHVPAVCTSWIQPF